MGMVDILFNDAQPFEKTDNTLRQKAQCEMLFLERADNPGGQNFDCNWKGLV